MSNLERVQLMSTETKLIIKLYQNNDESGTIQFHYFLGILGSLKEIITVVPLIFQILKRHQSFYTSL